MFDDCNTFFKGKPDGRDASSTGVPGTGANATPGTRRAVLQRARCAILTLRRFRPLGTSQSFARPSRAAHDTLGRYGLPQSAGDSASLNYIADDTPSVGLLRRLASAVDPRVAGPLAGCSLRGPAPIAHKDWRRADRVSLRSPLSRARLRADSHGRGVARLACDRGSERQRGPSGTPAAVLRGKRREMRERLSRGPA